jgi:hypothetical protein
MTNGRILALSFLPLHHSIAIESFPTYRIGNSGQAWHEPCALVEIAIVSVAYARLSPENFGEIVFFLEAIDQRTGL